ncbi:PaaI family thioesterase [Alisedimentitalea sp. MJ-SS2]|uniref:PaaI family thioesterase n=1 Tax=Aliisedimentitalea sp. MJ-SS2 TaxID=3049795 RepID=UPI00290B8D7D|nr:PaaI family thioesterase [Alisedimentitalea sp. MJ-SS2]MDU8928706.1 PaaI family thioesterase [Alisedimentitalea sp. MJ-SS2]
MSDQRKYAQSTDDLPALDDILSMTGLEFMQAVKEGHYPGPPIGKTMGFWPTHVEDGKVIFTGTPTFDVMNPVGTVHGGWYGTVLDSCMACAIQTKVPKGSTYTTLEYKVNIIRPIPIGTEVEAIGIVHHAGRSTGIADGEIRGKADGRLYATGSTTCIIMKIK